MTTPTNISPSILVGLSLEEAYAKLDKEIAQVQEHLCFLRALRNSLSPISKIPTELLSKVLSHSQESTDPLFPNNVDLDTRFVASWVCRQWRNTAVRTPALWTIISMKNREAPVPIDLAQELLVRSGSLGIFVNLFESTGDLLEIFIPQMHRIVGMRLGNIPRSFEFNELLSQPAPVLDALELFYTDNPTQSILSKIHPKIRGLLVTGVDFLAFPPSILTTLTRLHIIKSLVAIEPDYFVRVLPSMQNLIDLVLVKVFQRDGFTHPTTRLSLPSLQSITLSDDASGPWFSLLAFLDIPQAEIVFSWPEDFVPRTHTLADFYNNLAKYQRFAGFTIRHLKIERYPPNFIFDISSSPSQYYHSFRFPNHHLEKEDTNSIAARLPLDRLESLSTTELPDVLLNAVLDARSLSNITLWGVSAVKTFIIQFGRSFETKDKMQFPAVQELTIGLIKNNQLYGLEAALATRSAMGKVLDRLTFVSSPNVDVERFRDLVGSISVID